MVTCLQNSSLLFGLFESKPGMTRIAAPVHLLLTALTTPLLYVLWHSVAIPEHHHNPARTRAVQRLPTRPPSRQSPNSTHVQPKDVLRVPHHRPMPGAALSCCVV